MYSYCTTPLKKLYRASQVWDHLSSWRTTAVHSFFPLLSAGLWSQSVHIHSHFQPILPLTCWHRKVNLSLTDIRIHLSPVILKPMAFLRHTEPCRRCFGPHVDTSAGNMPRISNFIWCFKVLVWKVWLKFKVPLQFLLFFHEHNSKQQHRNRHNKLSKEKAEEEQEFFFLKYCYAFWLTLNTWPNCQICSPIPLS